MKLTWFSHTTIRVHIGGRILVAGPTAIDGISAEELLSGADAAVDLDGSLPRIDPVLWQPRRSGAMLDEETLPEVLVHGLAGGALIAAAGEAPLVVLTGEPERGGRWAHEAVVVVLGEDVARRAAAVLDTMMPRLVALAASEAVVDAAVSELAGRLNGTALQALEPGMAVEV